MEPVLRRIDSAHPPRKRILFTSPGTQGRQTCPLPENQQKVWAIAAESKVKESVEHYRDYSKIIDEAEAIVHGMSD
jgi:hypothetical protein